MIEHLDFPASSGSERLNLIEEASKPFSWDDLTHEGKVAFVRGMDRGYFQGMREQAKRTIDLFTQAIVGFRP